MNHPSSSRSNSPTHDEKVSHTPQLDNTLISPEQSLQKAIAKYGSTHPKCAALYNKLGNAHFRDGRLSQAQECYQNAVCCDPCSCTASAYLNLGTVYWRMSDTAQAIHMLKQALACHEANLQGNQSSLRTSSFAASVFHQLGLCHALQKQFDNAVALLNKALAIRKRLNASVDVGKTLSALANVMTMKGDKQEAVAYHEQSYQILATHQAVSALYLNNLAKAYEDVGENGKALAMYTELLTIHGPESSDATKRAPTEQKVKQLMEHAERLHDLGTSVHEASSLNIPEHYSPAVVGIV